MAMAVAMVAMPMAVAMELAMELAMAMWPGELVLFSSDTKFRVDG